MRSIYSSSWLVHCHVIDPPYIHTQFIHCCNCTSTLNPLDLSRRASQYLLCCWPERPLPRSPRHGWSHPPTAGSGAGLQSDAAGEMRRVQHSARSYGQLMKKVASYVHSFMHLQTVIWCNMYIIRIHRKRERERLAMTGLWWLPCKGSSGRLLKCENVTAGNAWSKVKHRPTWDNLQAWHAILQQKTQYDYITRVDYGS